MTERTMLVLIFCNLFNTIKMNYKKLYFHYGYFDLWASFYNQIMVILPLIITIPELFNGNITLRCFNACRVLI